LICFAYSSFPHTRNTSNPKSFHGKRYWNRLIEWVKKS
jgi:hypothetical protein